MTVYPAQVFDAAGVQTGNRCCRPSTAITAPICLIQRPTFGTGRAGRLAEGAALWRGQVSGCSGRLWGTSGTGCSGGRISLLSGLGRRTAFRLVHWCSPGSVLQSVPFLALPVVVRSKIRVQQDSQSLVESLCKCCVTAQVRMVSKLLHHGAIAGLDDRRRCVGLNMQEQVVIEGFVHVVLAALPARVFRPGIFMMNPDHHTGIKLHNVTVSHHVIRGRPRSDSMKVARVTAVYRPATSQLIDRRRL